MMNRGIDLESWKVRRFAGSETWTRIRIFSAPFNAAIPRSLLSFRPKLFAASIALSRSIRRFEIRPTRNKKNYQFPLEKEKFIHGKRIGFSLSETRGVQRDSGELGQVGWPAMVRDSGSKHQNSRTSGRPPRRMAGRSGGRVSARLARNWFQPGGRDSWFHGESFVPAEGEHPTLSPLFSSF